MSIIEQFHLPIRRNGRGVAVKMPTAARALHRLAEVRELQGVSRRTLAQRLNTDVAGIKDQEQSNADLPISKLYEWQEALEVPVAELLVESGDPLSPPVMKRAQMVRLMKTAKAILQRSRQLGIQRMGQVLVDQLVEIMPELEEVAPWPSVGRRRGKEEVGQAARRRIWPEFGTDMPE